MQRDQLKARAETPSCTNYWRKHWSAKVQGAAVTCCIPTGRRHCPIFICSLNLEQGVVDRKSQYVTAGRCFPPECAVHKRWHH